MENEENPVKRSIRGSLFIRRFSGTSLVDAFLRGGKVMVYSCADSAKLMTAFKVFSSIVLFERLFPGF
jgi:hypothetical protein